MNATTAMLCLCALVFLPSTGRGQLRIVPEHATVRPDGQRRFHLYESDGRVSRRVEAATWSAVGGQVDQGGRFRAAKREGLAIVTATTKGRDASAHLRIGPPDRDAARAILRPASLRCTLGTTQAFTFEVVDGWGRPLPTRCVWQAGPAFEALGEGRFRPLRSGRLTLGAMDPYSGLTAQAELWVSPKAAPPPPDDLVVRHWKLETRDEGWIAYDIHLEATHPDSLWVHLWHVSRDGKRFRAALLRCRPGQPILFRGLVDPKRVEWIEALLLDGHERPLARYRRPLF